MVEMFSVCIVQDTWALILVILSRLLERGAVVRQSGLRIRVYINMVDRIVRMTHTNTICNRH